MLRIDKIIGALIAAQIVGIGLLIAAGVSLRKAPKPQVLSLPAYLVLGDTANMLGSKQAPYTLVEFGDYECPPCIASHPKVQALLKKYPNDLRFQFRNLPLAMHPGAKPAAVIAEAARLHGNFWPTHDHLYSRDIASELNTITFETGFSDADKQKAEQTVLRDMADAKKMGVNSTPTFMLCLPNGKTVRLGNVEQAEKLLPAP